MRPVETLHAVSRAAPLAVCAGLLAGAAAAPLAAATTSQVVTANTSMSYYAWEILSAEVDLDVLWSVPRGPLSTGGKGYADARVTLNSLGTESDSGMGAFTVTSNSPYRFTVNMLFFISGNVDAQVLDFVDYGLYDLSATLRTSYRIGDGPGRTAMTDVIDTRLDCSDAGVCEYGFFTLGEGFPITLTMNPGDTHRITLFASADAALTRVAPPATVPLPAGFGPALAGLFLLGALRARR